MSTTDQTPIFSITSKFEDFIFWFIRTGEDCWNIYDRASREIRLENQSEAEILANTALSAEFSLFKTTRPEYFVGSAIYLEPAEDRVFYYDTLLAGAILCRAYKNGHNPDAAINQINSVLSWLKSTDFYEAPASTQYHESFEGGLLLHSLKVYNCAIDVSKISKFSSITADEYTLLSLVHDWCKIGLYEKYNRNVKNEQTGKWEQVVAFKHSMKNIPLGHGVTSMFLANKFIRLSSEESLAIRWHMGKWNVADNEMNDLQLANETYPLVHFIQFADQLSIVSY